MSLVDSIHLYLNEDQDLPICMAFRFIQPLPPRVGYIVHSVYSDVVESGEDLESGKCSFKNQPPISELP